MIPLRTRIVLTSRNVLLNDTHRGLRLTDITVCSATRPSIADVGQPAQSTENGRDGQVQASALAFSRSYSSWVMVPSLSRVLAEAIWSVELGLAATYWMYRSVSARACWALLA